MLLRSELVSLGSTSELTKALKAMVATGVLVRISVGIYAKTRKSSVTGATVPAGSLETLALEALQKLGVTIEEGAAASEYNTQGRRSCQAPLWSTRGVGAVAARFKLAAEGWSMKGTDSVTIKHGNLLFGLRRRAAR